MTIVVSGCGGLLGSELCRHYGREAVGVDLPDFDLTRLDRAAAVASLRPTVIINAAGYTFVDRAEKEPKTCWAVNVDGVANLVRVCRDLNCRLVQISTDYVFCGDSQRSTPYSEDERPCPRGVYAESKYESERIASRETTNLIVRSCGFYGRPAPRSAGSFVETILRAAAAGRALRVVNDQRCTPTYVAHFARAIRFLVQAGAAGVYHVTNAGETTWHGFAEEIVQQSRRAVEVTPISTADWAAPAPRPAYSVLDCSKYRSLPGAPPLPHWKDALAEYLDLRDTERAR
jgi:dTDP-4-dehydrorhamnose reductase